MVEAKRGPRSRQADADLHSAMGILQLFAIADHLGRESAGGNSFLCAAFERGMADSWARAGCISLRNTVSDVVVAIIQTRSAPAGLVGGVASVYAFCRFVLVHRTGV